MKLYAQHGASQGEKTLDGIKNGYLDGVIYSPRDIAAPRLRDHIEKVAQAKSGAEQFFDPQYYAAFNVTHPEARMGNLKGCEEYARYFRTRRRRQIEADLDTVRGDIRDCLEFQDEFDLSAVVAPNILISRSLDSIETAIAKTFVREAGQMYADLAIAKPLYATLAVSREALMDERELVDFMTDITLLENRPRGFYVLVAARNEEARTDIYNADVIGAWLFINYALAVNGFDVINGYSDILTPFLGAAGAGAGATGWWSNLRHFSLSRFLPAGGGRQPVTRYLSKLLLNRITYYELHQLRDDYPVVLNGLGSDEFYPEEVGSEPERANEVLQTWETIKSLCDGLLAGTTAASLRRCGEAISAASAAYDEISAMIPLDRKSNGDHLAALGEGLGLFRRLAELEAD